MAETAASRWTPRNPDGSIRWSWHVIENYLECPRKFQLAVLDDLVSLEYQQPRSLGSCVHRGLAAAFRRLQKAQARMGGAFSVDLRGRQILEAAAVAEIEADPGVTETDRIEALRLVRAYCQGGLYECEAGALAFSAWGILNVETTVHADLRVVAGGKHKIQWSQTPDLIVSVEDGINDGLWVVDHKTTSRMSRMSLSKFYIDGQALALVATLRSAGIPVQGFIPNLIVKTKAIQFATQFVDFDEATLAKFATEIGAWQRSIKARMRRAGRWPRNYHACIGAYGYCDFYERCHLGDAAGYAPRGQVTIGAAAADLDRPWTVEG